MSTYRYKAVVANDSGSVISDTVYLTVIEQTNITTAPSDMDICGGSDNIFNVVATGASLTYVWKLNNVTIGTNADSYSITNASSVDEGTYSCIATGTCGLDSIGFEVTVNVIDVTVTNNSNTLTATAGGMVYQWIDCNDNNSPISGATSQSYVATANGDYAVIISDGSCTDTSDCVSVTGMGLTETEKVDIAIYPNPVSDFITIENKSNLMIRSIEIFDITGKQIVNVGQSELNKNNQLNVSRLAEGVYVIKINTPERTFINRIIKN